MPPVFKALATIAAWVLFVFGLFEIVISLVFAFVGGFAVPPPFQTFFAFAIGVSSLTLSVVVMRLRQKME